MVLWCFVFNVVRNYQQHLKEHGTDKLKPGFYIIMLLYNYYITAQKILMIIQVKEHILHFISVCKVCEVVLWTSHRDDKCKVVHNYCLLNHFVKLLAILACFCWICSTEHHNSHVCACVVALINLENVQTLNFQWIFLFSVETVSLTLIWVQAIILGQKGLWVT